MIKFFRKIRQRLVSENKFSKYLIYAIGEIVLVVVGILIALQINNWNENQKINDTVQNYYNQLLQDLNKDKVYIEKTISFLDSSMTNYNTYLDSYKVPDMSLEQAITFQSSMDYLSKSIIFNTNTIQTLENTGDIKLLPFEIKNQLSKLKRNQDMIIYISNSNADTTVKTLELLAIEVGSFTLSSRLSNQPRIAKAIDLGKNYDKIFMIFEAAAISKYLQEQKDMKALKKLLIDENTLINLISDEMKK